MKEPSDLAAELDAMHARARAAFERRDLAAYRAVFAPDLTYRQADGRVIGLDRLMEDVAEQFRRFRRVRSSFVREALETEGDRATEVVSQTASAELTAFLVVRFSWEVNRRGRYAWGRNEGGWRIESVDVLEERVRPGRVSVGFGPRGG